MVCSTQAQNMETLRLKMICNRLAPEVIEESAQVVSSLIEYTQELAFDL